MQSRSQDHVVDLVHKRKRLLILRLPQEYNYLSLDVYSYPPQAQLKAMIQWFTCIVFSRIDGVMVCVFESGKTIDYKIIVIFFCSCDYHAAIRRNSKYWCPRYQNSVSEWSNMSTCGNLFQLASAINIKLNMLV